MSRLLENAIVRLLIERPFYGFLLVGLHRRCSAGPAPLGITLHDGLPVLACNEAVLAAYTPVEQEALLEHCLKHLLHLHMTRRKERNRSDWDIACDLAINPAISNIPFGAPLPDDRKLPIGLAAEEYYQRLVAPFDSGNLSGDGIGTGHRDQGGAVGEGTGEAAGGAAPAATAQQKPIDDHLLWDEADSTPLRLAEEVVRGMVRDAWQKCDGKVPGELQTLVSGYLAPPLIPWQQILRQFLATAGRVGRQSTWQRENRRFSHTTPGARKRHKLNLLIGIDVSDSTNTAELREAFARELLHIARGRDAVLTVLYANSRIQRIEALRGSSVVPAVYHGGGFTDLRPVFEYARTIQPRPVAVIYLTDGIGPVPEAMEFPTLWVLTREGEKPAPWGVELRLDR